ncbi:MAG: prepilin-type N-terminal cleavage/methylation domain-containing protein, partial [Elusimicrobia bacterium]|nr:prepilin-type N-terminal cleavage/methylation domain-containing protein [Elusimicrobiota bacterium]
MEMKLGLKVRKGVSLIELAIVIAISGVLIFGIVRILKTSFDVWLSSLHNIDIQQKGRTAVEEMTRFIRQSSVPVTGITPAIGGTATEISFKYIQDTGTIKDMKYYFNSGNLYRVMNG